MENKVYGTFNTKFVLSVGGTDDYKKLTVKKVFEYAKGKYQEVVFDVTTSNRILDASLVRYVESKGEYEIWIDFRKVKLTKDNRQHEFDVAGLMVGIPSSSAIITDLKVNTEDNNYKNLYKSWLLMDCVPENLIHEVEC